MTWSRLKKQQKFIFSPIRCEEYVNGKFLHIRLRCQQLLGAMVNTVTQERQNCEGRPWLRVSCCWGWASSWLLRLPAEPCEGALLPWIYRSKRSDPEFVEAWNSEVFVNLDEWMNFKATDLRKWNAHNWCLKLSVNLSNFNGRYNFSTNQETVLIWLVHSSCVDIECKILNVT